MNRENQIIGYIVGGAIGDAWGSYYENEVYGCEVCCPYRFSISFWKSVTRRFC